MVAWKTCKFATIHSLLKNVAFTYRMVLRLAVGQYLHAVKQVTLSLIYLNQSNLASYLSIDNDCKGCFASSGC